VSLMGGMMGNDLKIPIGVVVHRDLVIRGKWMYSRQNVYDLIKMIEVGVLNLGGLKVEKFGLEEWEKGFDAAAGYVGGDELAVIVP